MPINDYLEHIGFDEFAFLLAICVFYVTSAWIVPICLLLIIGIFSWRIFRKWRELEMHDGKDKHVLVTGCDSGIGFAFAKRLDKMGFSVFATCLSDTSDGALELKKSGSPRMRISKLDVTSEEDIKTCLQRVQSVCGKTGLWGLVNNAGTSLGGDAEIQSMENFKYFAELNLFGVVRMCKTFLPLVRKRKGRVVNVTSLRGRLAFPTASPYCMSKFGAEGFSDSLRLEMRRFGVKVIIVEPGGYGLYVGQYSETNREKMRVQYQKMIDSVDDEVRQAYGQAYLDTYVTRIPRAFPFSEDKLRGVVDCLYSAVASVHPRVRYLADNTTFWMDGNCMMTRLRDYLPEEVMDRVLLWMRPLVQETYTAMKPV